MASSRQSSSQSSDFSRPSGAKAHAQTREQSSRSPLLAPQLPQGWTWRIEKIATGVVVIATEPGPNGRSVRAFGLTFESAAKTLEGMVGSL